MKDQISFTEVEYQQRRKTTKRETFLKEMEKHIPWTDWVKEIEPYYPSGNRGRKPIEIETMLRMLLLQVWFNLSDEGIEDAIYDSYAMKQFMGIRFDEEQVPDSTTLCKFRKLLTDNGLQEKLFRQIDAVLEKEHKMVRGGSIVDATIIEASSNKKNTAKKTDPEMHSVKKGTKWFFGMRAHVAVDPIHGFIHNAVCTPANTSECKVAPQLLRPDDEVVYGDAGYLKMERYVEDGIKRYYRINRQRGTFKKHYGDSISWVEEKEIEKRKSSTRCKIEYVFHVAKDIFHWRKARYKGIAKNNAFAQLVFASVNLYMLSSCCKTCVTG